MAGKYTRIQKYLEGKPSSINDVSLSFDQIEQIIGDHLPKSAFTHRAWWENENTGSHVQAHAWMDAGWNVESVNLSEKLVRLIRN